MNNKVLFVYVQPYYSWVVKINTYFNGVREEERKRGKREMGAREER